MQKFYSYILFVFSIMFFCYGGSVHGDSGTFSTLTYNVAGLPQLLSSAEADRQEATEIISCYINAFDFINVQEDFNYHAALYDTCNNHPFRSPTTGGAGIGSGLNSLSRFSYTDWTRVSWDDCVGVDCLTAKGFTMARTRLAKGIYIDIYNLHAQASIGDSELAARRANILQLANYIEKHSSGNTVIVMGDTNTRYTRSGDNMRELLRRGFTDVWIEKVRDGNLPEAGSTALVCDPPVTSAECEVVDKVLYRNNSYVDLTAMGYAVRQDAFNSAKEALSDHSPIYADWFYETATDLRLSDQIGGPHGNAFNDVGVLPMNPSVAMVGIRAGRRVDEVMITLDSEYVLSHGGQGGDLSTLVLGDEAYLSSIDICSDRYNGHTRVFYIRFSTSDGRTLEGGTITDTCVTYTAPDSWQIVGFHGRSGEEVDKIGVIFAPYSNGSRTNVADYAQLINRLSGLCMDVRDAEMTSGNDVIQWTCNGEDWQKWNYDAHTGLIRSKQDPRYCLDNGGTFGDGADMQIQKCDGSAAQRFTFNKDGTISIRSFPEQVVDGYGTFAGDDVGTWDYWGGENQYWTMVP